MAIAAALSGPSPVSSCSMLRSAAWHCISTRCVAIVRHVELRKYTPSSSSSSSSSASARLVILAGMAECTAPAPKTKTGGEIEGAREEKCGISGRLLPHICSR